MTDEEKLAIEIVNNLDTEIYDCEGSCVSIYDHMESACLAGIKASKPKWHDLRKNPKDLPKKHGEYWVYCYSLGYEKLCYMAVPYGERWGTLDEVIAWTELPKFEEK